MLTVFLFDEGESEQVEDWRAAPNRLASDQLLWLALRDPTEEEVAALQESLEPATSTHGGCSSSRAKRLCRMRASACI